MSVLSDSGVMSLRLLFFFCVCVRVCVQGLGFREGALKGLGREGFGGYGVSGFGCFGKWRAQRRLGIGFSLGV